MRKIIFSLILLISTFSCKKIKESTNKYAPYKLVVEGLTKRYRQAATDMKTADNAEEVTKILGFLADSHKAAKRVIHKFKKKYPELESSKSSEFPENLKENVKSYQKARKEFSRELSKKLKEYNNNKQIKSKMGQWIRAAKSNNFSP